jgi:tol-pal system protein YbgF
MSPFCFPRAARNNALRASLVLLVAVAATQPTLSHAQAQPDTRNPGVIQLMNQVETLQAELNKLRGQLEVLNNGLENAQKRQRDMYLDLDTRLRRIEQQSGDAAHKEGQASELDARIKRLEQQASGDAKERDSVNGLEARIKRLEQQAAAQVGTIPPPVSAATPPAAITATPTAPTPPSRPTPPTVPGATTSPTPTTLPAVPVASEPVVRKAYDSGIAAYKTGDYQGAIAAFDGIVKRYPRDPLAPNAQYWIGDAWFNLRDFKSAAAAQQALLANYPDSPKVPDALLNLGSAHAAMGDNTTARKTLEDLIARFPLSDAAEKGKARLARLK